MATAELVIDHDVAESIGRRLLVIAHDQSVWSQATFGSDLSRGPVGPLKHLASEAQEAQKRPVAEEFADCLLLTLDAARRAGVSVSSLIDAALKKLDVNIQRPWPDLEDQKPDEPVEHLRLTGNKKREHLSPVALSNIYTMQATSKVDPRQTVPTVPTIPTAEERELRCRLILEEAWETVNALGFRVLTDNGGQAEYADTFERTRLAPGEFKGDPQSMSDYDGSPLEDIIDGCCDLAYVAIGTMIKCGVPDLIHLQEVCDKNDAKFPGGVATVNEHGKYMKPEGWTPPKHMPIVRRVGGIFFKESSASEALDLPATCAVQAPPPRGLCGVCGSELVRVSSMNPKNWICHNCGKYSPRS